jgi:hypothetical protein
MDQTSLIADARAALPLHAAPFHTRHPQMHVLVFPTSKTLEPVAPQLIQAVAGGKCMSVSMPDQYSIRGTSQDSHGAEAGFKDLLASNRGILTVAREQNKNFFDFLMQARGIVNICTQIYIFVMLGDERLGAEIISELIASGAEPAKITVVLCCSSAVAEDTGVFADMQACLSNSQVQIAGVHPHIVANVDLLLDVSRTGVLIGDLVHHTHDFAQDVETERRKGLSVCHIYEALDALVVQYQFHTQRDLLLDALEGLTASRISSREWLEMIYPGRVRAERALTQHES